MRNIKKSSSPLTKSEYSIEKSTIPKAGNGAFTNVDLPKGYTLGNYKGKKLSPAGYDRLRDSSYVWELSSPRGMVYIDGKPKKQSNWLRYLNDSRSERKNNVEPYQYRGKLYYRTKKKIPAGSELFISYGDSYWD